jgi:hypothetical protein
VSFLYDILKLFGLANERRPGLADALPIELAMYVGDDTSNYVLYVEDGAGNVVTQLKSDAAFDSTEGFLSFRLTPADLPDKIVLRQSSPFGRSHIAGPCDPIDLSKGLENVDLEALDPLLTESLADAPDAPNLLADATPIQPAEDTYPV